MPTIGNGLAWARPPEPAYPLANSQTSYWVNGRASIFEALTALHLPSAASALVPAYCCGSEVDAVAASGLQLRFYHINAKLEPDLEDIEAQLRSDSSIRVLFVTNYFGLPRCSTDVLALARTHNVLVLEDNAHGFGSADASGTPLGSIGDIGIFSFMKSIPVPDGGAAVFNGDARPVKNGAAIRTTPPLMQTLGRAKFMVEQRAYASFPDTTTWAKKRLIDPATTASKRLLKQAPAQPSRGSNSGERDEYEIVRLKDSHKGCGISAFSKSVLLHTNTASMVERRRRNFLALLHGLPEIDEIRPLVPSLPDNCCPLFFPVHCRDAERMQRFFTSQRIATKRFWSFFHPLLDQNAYADESALKNSVVVLPIHQGLDPRHIEQILAIIEPDRVRAALCGN